MRPSRMLFVVAVAVACPAFAQTAADVEDLVGARAAGGEAQLLSRGYELRQSNTVRDQSFTFWWNERTGRRISVSTVEGRYAAIIGVPSGNCAASPEVTAHPTGHGAADPFRRPQRLVGFRQPVGHA
ncbi:hypothetical protein [Luteimonas aestuarii]|uniref:hypothetical protein n=1 Tax=Luteimonas aestuarii TaxID=453837 RepID=UPI001A9CD44D|nr:hypothetical protein [Luteimonas aestuarii]